MIRFSLVRHDSTNEYTGGFYPHGKLLLKVRFPNSGETREGSFRSVLASLWTW